MGARSNTESIVAILKAFLDQRTWKQAALARHIGVSAATVHKRLRELQTHGIPLAEEREHPHVYWSVPKTWYPGGVVFTSEQIIQLFRLLSRMPASGARNLLLDNVLKCLPQPSASGAWVASEMTAREERQLPTIEDAANQQVALHFSYFSANRGNESTRCASVHRVLAGPPARFLATCHRSGKLKWFRVQNVSECRLQRSEPFREVDVERVEAHLRTSLNGFHADAQPAKHAFFVREPDARWVERNLIAGMHAHEAPGGIRVDVETAALKRLARFVVGLGAAARPLTKELEAEVTELARGALDASAPGRAFSRD
jgi:predicted DNA-binding transcriptional regulator YafY